MSKTTAGRACTNLATAKLVLRNGATPPLDPYTSRAGLCQLGTGNNDEDIGRRLGAAARNLQRVAVDNPDPDAPSRIPYAVKLATLRDDGKNVFDQTTGENDLGVEIEVQ